MVGINKNNFKKKGNIVVNFKGIEKFSYKGQHFKFYIDKNDSIHDVTKCEILTWKMIAGKRIPDEIQEAREVKLFEKIKGNPYKIAVQKTMTYIEAAEL